MEDEPVVKRKPRLGVAKGQFVIHDSFFEPLPDELLNAFYESEIFPNERTANDEAEVREEGPK